MQLDELLTKIRQREVMDFVLFLGEQCKQDNVGGHSDWSDHAYQAMSVEQAMRGLEYEPEIYSEDDLQEQWQ